MEAILIFDSEHAHNGGCCDLLASAFSSTLGSTVVTYDQYQKDKDDEKDEPVYYQALNVDQLFVASNLCAEVGERQIDTTSLITGTGAT